MTSAEFAQPKDKLFILKRVPLFASCTDEQLQLVAERARLVEFKKAEAVYRQGQRAEAFYVVASGRLRITSVTDGQEQVIAILHNGDTFGEIALLTGEMHGATVEALNDTLVFELHKQDFDDLINRIPPLVLYLSRLLSKRLRTKGQMGEAGEATVIAIHSAVKGSGRTMFAMALAAALQRETRRATIVVDFTTPNGESNPWVGVPRHSDGSHAITIKGFWSEESFRKEVQEHPLGFHVLYANQAMASGEADEPIIAPLVSGLTTHYGYVLLDLPVEIDAAVLKALTQADLMYLITDCTRQNLTRTRALIHQVREAIHQAEPRLRVFANLMDRPGERMDLAQAAEILGYPVNYVLPRLDTPGGMLSTAEFTRVLERDELAYMRVVRRIARELGGVLVGLALGSGAALGLAHIGVLKVIEREKIPIDMVAGSSIGALIGAFWASGKSAEELEALAARFEQPWKVRALFLDFGIPLFSIAVGLTAGLIVGALAGFWTGLMFGFMVTVAVGVTFGPLVGGPLQGDRVMQFLEQELGDKTFEDTRMPLKIVAAHPAVREEIIFESGRLADAVRTSSSIPGIFKPINWMGKVCLDGGVSNPVPVSVLRRAGVKRVIAVNVFPTTPELTAYTQEAQRQRQARDAQISSRPFLTRMVLLLGRELRRSMSPLIFDVIMRSMQSMEYQIAELACHDADVVLRPTVAGSYWLEFHHPKKFIQRGEEEAMHHLEELKHPGKLVSSTVPALPLKPPALTTSSLTGTIPQ